MFSLLLWCLSDRTKCDAKINGWDVPHDEIAISVEEPLGKYTQYVAASFHAFTVVMLKSRTLHRFIVAGWWLLLLKSLSTHAIRQNKMLVTPCLFFNH